MLLFISNSTFDRTTQVDALCAAGASNAHDVERRVPGMWSGTRNVTWTNAGRVLPDLHAICTNARPNGLDKRARLREQVRAMNTNIDFSSFYVHAYF